MKRPVLVLVLLSAGCGDQSEPSAGPASPARTEPGEASPQAVESAADAAPPQAVESAADPAAPSPTEATPADAESPEADPAGGCEPSIVPSPDPVSEIHVHGDTLLWIADHDDGDRLYVKTPGGVERVTLPGEPTELIVGGTRPLSCIDSTALLSLTLPGGSTGTVTEGRKYYCDAAASGERLFYNDGVRWQWIAKAGATPVKVEAKILSPEALWIDGDTVYWRNGVKLQALSPATETEPRVLADGLPLHAQRQVVHGDHLYWANRYQIVRMPKTGGAIETVARLQARPQIVAVDDSHVVWTIHSGWARLAHGALELERFHEPKPDAYDDFTAALADDGTLYFARRNDPQIRALAPACAWSRLSRHVAAPTVQPPDEPSPLYVTWHDTGFRVDDWSPTERSEIEDLREGPDPIDPADPRVPARYRPGTAYEIVSPLGRATAKIASIKTDERDSTLLVDVELDDVTCPSTVSPAEPDPVDELERCVGGYPLEHMLVFRAGEVPPKLRPRIPKPLPNFRRRLPKLERRPRVDRVVPVTLPGEGRFLAFVDPDEDEDREIDDPVRSGMALLDDEGARLEWIEPVERRMEMFSVEYLVDLDGDGLDEVVYQGHAEYSQHFYLLTVDAHGTVHTRVIGGDTDPLEP